MFEPKMLNSRGQPTGLKRLAGWLRIVVDETRASIQVQKSEKARACEMNEAKTQVRGKALKVTENPLTIH